jgi:hypothetical protein
MRPGGDDDPEKLRRVACKRVGDGGETRPKIRIILKFQGEGADRSYALGDACAADVRRQMQRLCCSDVEWQQLTSESELAQELWQPLMRSGAPKQRGGTLESLHSSSVAERVISAYIV